MQLEEDGTWTGVDSQSGAAVELRPAKVSLTDCLACSGCVTSAESVLIEAQSCAEFIAGAERAAKSGGAVVVSVAREALASMAVRFGLGLADMMRALARFFEGFGAESVADLAFASEFEAQEAEREFVARFRGGDPAAPLPLLCSTCPGWVCYAEKKHEAFILPHMSTVRSPQQLMGAIVKRYSPWRVDQGREVYHATVMMCYDKKLEASREDYYDSVRKSPDVDCVLTAREIEALMAERGFEPQRACAEGPGQRVLVADPARPPVLIERVFCYAARELFGIDLEGAPLVYHEVRNADYRELRLDHPATGERLLTFAAAHGFANIQTVIRKFKTGKEKGLHYVEMLACPAGCLNGGGQVKPSKDQTARQLLDQVAEAAAQANRDPIAEAYKGYLQSVSQQDKTLLFKQKPRLNPSALTTKW